MRGARDYNSRTGQPYCHAQSTGTDRARCNSISSHTGYSQHRVQSKSAQLHNNGRTLPWHLAATHAVYMLDYYLQMLSPNEGYNETGLTMQSAGPIRKHWQSIEFEFLFKGSEFGHWRVKGGRDAFAFRHPSLGQTDVYHLLASEAHHHKVNPIGTGRLIAMVGTIDAPAGDTRNLQILFGWSLLSRHAHPKIKRTTCHSNTQVVQPQSRRSSISLNASHQLFAQEQLLVLQDWYLASGQSLEPIDATVKDDRGPLPGAFFLHTMWMFGCTKPISKVTAVA